jgi:hypothetical protein
MKGPTGIRFCCLLRRPLSSRAEAFSLLHCRRLETRRSKAFLEKITHLLSHFVYMEINFSLVLHEQKQRAIIRLPSTTLWITCRDKLLQSILVKTKLIATRPCKPFNHKFMFSTTQLITKHVTSSRWLKERRHTSLYLFLSQSQPTLIARSDTKNVSAKVSKSVKNWILKSTFVKARRRSTDMRWKRINMRLGYRIVFFRLLPSRLPTDHLTSSASV